MSVTPFPPQDTPDATFRRLLIDLKPIAGAIRMMGCALAQLDLGDEDDLFAYIIMRARRKAGLPLSEVAEASYEEIAQLRGKL